MWLKAISEDPEKHHRVSGTDPQTDGRHLGGCAAGQEGVRTMRQKSGHNIGEMCCRKKLPVSAFKVWRNFTEEILLKKFFY